MGARRHEAAGRGVLLLEICSHGMRAAALRSTAEGRVLTRPLPRSFPGVRDGILQDLDGARRVLGALLAEVAAAAGVHGRCVVAAIGGTHLRGVPARGLLRLPRAARIRPAHVESVLDNAADLGLPRDHEVLHVLPARFHLDGVTMPRPPLEMRGRTLAVDATVVTVARLALDNLQRVLEAAGWELVDAAAGVLVTARATLHPPERAQGAVLIDLGAETTRACVYRQQVLQGLVEVAAGGDHISRDLAWALRLDPQRAETLKRVLGVARVRDAEAARRLRVPVGDVPTWVGQRAVAQVVQPRIREILALVRDGLATSQALSGSEHVVLVGGGAALPGVAALAEEVLGLPARTRDTAALPPVEACTVAAADTPPTLRGLATYASSWEPMGTRSAVAWTHGWSVALRRLRRRLERRLWRGERGGRRASGTTGPWTIPGRPARERARGGEDLEVRDVRVRA